jgi:hypothetical protein
MAIPMNRFISGNASYRVVNNDSSDKFLSGAMEVVEFGDEERLVAGAVGAARQGADLVIGAFHASGVGWVGESVQNPTAMRQQGLGQTLE